MAVPARVTAVAPGVDANEEREQIRSLLARVHERHGFDFRDYAYGSIRRRILSRLPEEGVESVAELEALLLRGDSGAMERLLVALTIHVTAMFRDPSFYQAIREHVVPLLRTYPFLRVWHAGCSSGEEVYSMAILLEEEGLYDRCRLYATDINDSVLRRARAGIVPLSAMRDYTRNYLQAGGKQAFSDYYVTGYDCARLRPSLLRNVVFAAHNLVTDRSFNEFHCILCRNVVIYFNHELETRVFALLDQSLIRMGVLGLGSKESLNYTPLADKYEPIAGVEHLYRKCSA